MQGSLIKLSGVCCSYQTPERETDAVRDLSFSVDEGEFVAIVGPSGCGKTTVLSLIMGLMQPSSGSITVRDGSKCGYMLQRDSLLGWRSVRKNALLALEVTHAVTPEGEAKVDALIKRCGLSDFAGSRPAQLSGGMRQKVALIRTLSTDPDLLLLDEPFSALDYQTRLTLSVEVYSLIKSCGKTAILVTHDISEAVSMADRVLVFSNRPATLRYETQIYEGRANSPLERRNQAWFSSYFSDIWEELQA